MHNRVSPAPDTPAPVMEEPTPTATATTPAPDTAVAIEPAPVAEVKHAEVDDAGAVTVDTDAITADEPDAAAVAATTANMQEPTVDAVAADTPVQPFESFEIEAAKPVPAFVTPTSRAAAAAKPDLMERYVALLSRFRYAFALFLLACIALGVIFGPALLTKISFDSAAPPDTPSYKDQHAVDQLFPHLADGSTLLIYAETTADDILSDGYLQVFLGLNASLATSTYWPIVTSYEGYYTLFDVSPAIAQSYVSPSGRAAMWTIGLTTNDGDDESADAVDFIQTELDKLARDIDPHTTYTVEGFAALIPVAAAGTERDFVTVDGVALPFALVIFSILVGSIRAVLIPIAGLITSALISMALMNPVATHMAMPSFVPSLMMSLLVALNVDYSLFLLTRLQEEDKTNTTPVKLIALLLRTSGHTAVVSGFTLSFCFLGLLILPLEVMRTVGIGACLSVLSCMAMAFLQTPLLLLFFPRFFGVVPTQSPACCRAGLAACKRRTPPADTPKQEVDVFEDRSVWAVLGRALIKKPVAVVLILVVVGATMPVNLRAFDFKTDDAITQVLPRGDRTTEALKGMSAQFGAGFTSPYSLVVQPSDGIAVVSQPFFDRVTTIIARLSKLPNTHASQFTTLAWIGALNQSVPVAMVTSCASSRGGLCEAVNSMAHSFVNPAKTAIWMQYRPSFEPASATGRDWLLAARSLLQGVSKELHVNVFITGGAAEDLDSIDAVFDSFPMMIGVTSAVVLLFFGVSFKSIVIPIRAVATIALTLVFVFGFAVLVYGDNVLEGAGWAAIQGSGSVQWIIPIMAFSLLVGVALDYDAFLLVRIQEAWQEGMATPHAILFGLTKTGHIITAAGLIMAIAFGGLLFSSVPALNEISLYLVLAVVYDTVVIRALVVPAIMALLGEANWWPMKPRKVLLAHDSEPVDQHTVPNPVDVTPVSEDVHPSPV